MRTDDPAAVIGETDSFFAITVIAAIDQTLPGTYLPRFDTNQILAATGNDRVSPEAMITCRQVSINNRYVRKTTSVARAIQDQPMSSVAILSAACLHWPLRARTADQMMNAAKIHCAATNALRRLFVKNPLVDACVLPSG